VREGKKKKKRGTSTLEKGGKKGGARRVRPTFFQSLGTTVVAEGKRKEKSGLRETKTEPPLQIEAGGRENKSLFRSRSSRFLRSIS